MKRALLSCLGICFVFVGVLLSHSQGASLALVSTTSSIASGSIQAGAPTYSLDLRLDTGGLAISGLQYYLDINPANTLKFAASPLVALNTPFTTNDIFSGPASGVLVNQSSSATILFKASAGDYAPFTNSVIARYLFDTSLLAPGSYAITPVGQELTNASTTLTNFTSAGSFLLIVNVPEPKESLLVLLGILLLTFKGRQVMRVE